MSRKSLIAVLGLIAVVLVGLLAVNPAFAVHNDVCEDDAAPVSVLQPVEGMAFSVALQPEFIVAWNCYTDALFYQVRVYMPVGEDGAERFIEYRYNPDTDDDWRRDNAQVTVTTGLLEVRGDHWITVQPYGPSELMLAEYTEEYMPTGLGPEYYVPLAPPSAPVTIRIEP